MNDKCASYFPTGLHREEQLSSLSNNPVQTMYVSPGDLLCENLRSGVCSRHTSGEIWGSSGNWDRFLRRRGNKSRLPFARCGRISNPASQSQAAAAHTPLASLVRWFALVWLTMRAWTRWLHFDVTTHSGKAPNSNLVCGMQLEGWNVVQLLLFPPVKFFENATYSFL